MKSIWEIDKGKIEEFCKEEIGLNINNERKLPSSCKLLHYHRNERSIKFIARRFSQLMTGERKNFYDSAVDFFDSIDLNSLAEKFPACLIWFLHKLKEKKLTILSHITEDSRELILEKFEDRYRVRLGYKPLVCRNNDVSVTLYFHTTSWITDGFLFKTNDGQAIMSILSHDFIGTVIHISKDFVNKDNELIWNGNSVKDIYSIDDFTYDKFNLNMISEEVFNYIKNMLINKKLERLEGLDYFILSLDMTLNEDRKEAIKVIEKLVSDARERFSKLSENILTCNLRLGKGGLIDKNKVEV